MGTYIHFTDEQKERANSVDLEEFLRQRGEKLLRAGRESRLARVHHITVRGNEWYDHIARQGGHAVSFVQHYYGMSYQDAMELLLGKELGEAYPAAQPKREEPPKPFALPPLHTDMRRVYAYLMKQRHISREVITHFARAGLLYEDAQYHNCVFVGTDKQGVPRHAHKRSTNSQGKSFKVNVEGSKPQYSFHHVGQDGLLYVFEAPIDLLSFLMQTRLRLFLEWGITFGEPYQVSQQAARKVYYASKAELTDAIYWAFPAPARQNNYRTPKKEGTTP